MSKHPYDMKTPCADCPFRKSAGGYLRGARVDEIRDTIGNEFPCHKTTEEVQDDEGNADRERTDSSKICAGSLIMQEREGWGQMGRIAMRLNMLDPEELPDDPDVYADWEEMREAHEERRPKAQQ